MLDNGEFSTLALGLSIATRSERASLDVGAAL